MTAPGAGRHELTGWVKAAVDFGPLALFFAANTWGGRVAPLLPPGLRALLFEAAPADAHSANLIFATAVLMLAIAAAVAVSWSVTRHVPAMLWFTAGIAGVFGGLTIALHDATFIKMKPTVIFLIFAGLIWFGLWRGRNYLQLLLGKAFDGLSALGWDILAKRWALFFVAMAITNEILWRYFSTDVWVNFKVWGDTVITMIFALAQTRLLMKHGVTFDR
jgi:intracellular septation protein